MRRNTYIRLHIFAYANADFKRFREKLILFYEVYRGDLHIFFISKYPIILKYQIKITAHLLKSVLKTIHKLQYFPIFTSLK